MNTPAKRRYIIALDQGTTSSRCVIFDNSGKIVQVVQKEFKQIWFQEEAGWEVVSLQGLRIFRDSFSEQPVPVRGSMFLREGVSKGGTMQWFLLLCTFGTFPCKGKVQECSLFHRNAQLAFCRLHGFKLFVLARKWVVSFSRFPICDFKSAKSSERHVLTICKAFRDNIFHRFNNSSAMILREIKPV